MFPLPKVQTEMRHMEPMLGQRRVRMTTTRAEIFPFQDLSDIPVSFQYLQSLDRRLSRVAVRQQGCRPVKQAESRRCVLLILGCRSNSVPRLTRRTKPSPTSSICCAMCGWSVCQCEHKQFLWRGEKTEDNQATRRSCRRRPSTLCSALLCRSVPSAVSGSWAST
ncbi:hypothetical protein BDU57DRAFT_120250 [Ampelomyces quisqualis]|uniref:Uncharacterized protein n=1 Tax=Ampelomyces quisqualis TaxID=50730 RepID=A0A6A5QSY3_AMPQU|nr:hypothetical protein BDU57DRAFT_120250 [Ampelomyces quisqualis]